jgi:iron complex outermembrane receptor protein
MYADTEIPIYRTSPSYAALQTPSGPVPGQFIVRANNPGWAPFMAANPGVLPATATGALLVANRPFALGGNPLFNYGSSEGPRNYDGFRVSTGLNGDISDSLHWDVAVTYMEQNNTREGRDTVVNRYQLALLGLGGPGCNTAANTPGANGCFFYNPFNNAIPGNPITGQANAQFVPARPTESRAGTDVPGRLDRSEEDHGDRPARAERRRASIRRRCDGMAAGAQYRDTFEATYSDRTTSRSRRALRLAPASSGRRRAPGSWQRRPARCCSSAAPTTVTSIAMSAPCSPS